MTTNTYGGYTVDQLREFIRHHYDAEHGGDNIDELTNDSSASVKIVRDLLDAIEPQQDGDLLRPIARWVYNAVRVNLDLLHGICSEFGCPQGEDVATWLRDHLSNAKSPAPEQASEAAQQRPGMDSTLMEVVPAAECIVGARARGSNGTSSKVSRAHALTDAEIWRMWCSIDHNVSTTRPILFARMLLAAPPVEQPTTLTAQEALAAIETFEIVGESNDSREPNDDDRFLLHEFIAHAFGGYPVEQHEAAPADELIQLTDEEKERRRQWVREWWARRDASQPEPPAADERAAIDAVDAVLKANAVFFGREKLRQIVEAVRASSPNAAGAEGAKAQTSRIKAIIDAIEGECDGLAIDENQAVRILFYLDSTSPNGIVRAPRTDVAGAVPEGWKLMPVDPTVEMLTFVYDPGADDTPSERYAALLAAAPQPPSADAAAAPADVQAVEAVAIGEHDMSTSDGGRGYIAEFFATRLRRHDFGRYINESLAADFACALAQYLRGQDATTPAPASARPTDDELWDQTLRERDEYEETANKLAAAIAKHFGVDIGEHSNANCPWDEALEVIENAAPASTIPEIDPPQSGGNKGKLPALARTREGHNLYSLGYNRGLKKGRNEVAPASAPVGLTDGQRKAIEWAIGMASQHNIHHSLLRALLKGDKQ
ncbi:hypothetical protein [Burkholderia anthina]|nr:hypothetical protein [Burkholderia anthina]